ncbi:MAG: hypothetical protein H3C45_09215, partial [Bacteroidia bacterium]|nr:hypothetical protein [Bacteroidia bacterium]
KIKDGILFPSSNTISVEPNIAEKLNFIYAKTYAIEKDLFIILSSFRRLDS